MSSKNSRAVVLAFMASLITVYFFVNFQKAVLIPVFNELQTDFGVGAGAVTGVTTLFMLVYAAMQFATGLLVDRYGGIRVLIFGSVFMATGAMMLPLSRWLWMVYLARALTGIGAGTIYLSTIKEIDHLFPGSFTKVLGITMLVGYIGTGFTGLPVIWAIKFFGSWRIALGIFDGVLAVATLLLLTFSFGVEKTPINNNTKLFSSKPYVAAFRNRNLMHLLCSTPFMYATFLMLLNTIVKKMMEDAGHCTPERAGFVFSVMVAISAGIQLLPGLLENVVHRRRKGLFIAQLSTGWVGIALAAVGILCGGKWVPMAIGMWMLAAAGGFTPLTTSIYREVSDPKGIGVALSLSNGMVYLLIFASGQLAGFMLDLVGGSAIEKVVRAGKEVIVYPPRAYLAVLGLLLVMVSFAIWNGSRVPETNGKNIYRP